MSQALPFSTGTGTPTDAAAAAPTSTATEIAVSKGFWRDTNQLLERVVSYLRSIASPQWFDPATYALRITYPSGTTLSTVTTVSTVTTLSNQSQIGSVDAKTAFADQLALAAWGQTVRGRLA